MVEERLHNDLETGVKERVQGLHMVQIQMKLILPLPGLLHLLCGQECCQIPVWFLQYVQVSLSQASMSVAPQSAQSSSPSETWQ